MQRTPWYITTLAILTAPLVVLPASASQAAAVKAPFGGWFAGFAAGRAPGYLQTRTDPINLAIHDPRGNASGVFERALRAHGGWGYNTCLNWSVSLRPDLNSAWQAPMTSYATDVSYNGGDWWVVPAPNTCGNGHRDHLRLWRTANNQWAYVAASMEHPGCGVHCVDSNGFNQGRDQLAAAISDGLRRMRRTFRPSRPVPYRGNSISGIRYDGTVAYFDLT